MINDSDPPHDYKQIEDIIDERKKMGQYDVDHLQQNINSNTNNNNKSNSVNYRYAYSSPTSNTTTEKFIRFDEASMLANEGDFFSGTELKPTDSEITVVRVRCGSSAFKRCPSKWDMHDVAVPGDGSHLGESPSMVNLATLVEHNEYLVPLSSWDPYCKSEPEPTRTNSYNVRDSLRVEQVTDGQINVNTSVIMPDRFSELNSSDLDLQVDSNFTRRPSLAGRISKFLRKHWTRTKTLPDSNGCQPNGNDSRRSSTSKR